MPIDTVNTKLQQANTIKGQIREAIIEKDIPIPVDTPFSAYPALVQSIHGSLQTKTLTPDAAGQTALPDTGYDGFSSVALPAEPNLIPSNIVRGTSIFNVIGTSEAPSFDVNALLNGTLVDITSGVSALKAYCFYNDTSLQTITMNNLTTLGDYAFSGCTTLTSVQCAALATIGQYAFNECQNLVTLDLTHITSLGNYALYNCRKIANIGNLTLPDIPVYACYYLAANDSMGFVYAPATAATLGIYAFQYAKMTRLTGTLGNIGDHGIANCTALTQIDAKFTGSLAQYALANNTYVNSLDIDPDSNITSLGSGAFQYMGGSRANPSTNVFEMDLRNSTFNVINQVSFGNLQYTNLYLPASVGEIKSSAFSSSSYINLYFTGATPPTILSTYWLLGASNYKLFVPYDRVNAYKTATNWTAQVANIVGYAPEGTFTAGETLPTYNGEGMELTWYSDMAKTIVVTTVPAGSPELYCSSANRIKWVVSVRQDANTSVTLVDTEGVSYTVFPAYVPVGRGITIDIAERTGWNNNTIVNGSVVTLPYSVALLSTDIAVRSASWQGEIDPDFTNCTWANIKTAVEVGVASTVFTVGSTRTIRTKDNQTFTLRLANNTDDMYAYASGVGSTGFVMEFVEMWKDYKNMNPTATNEGGWVQSYMRTTIMPLIFAQLPDDLQAVIATVKIKTCESGMSGTLLTSYDTLFLPAERELFASRSYSRTEEWNALSRWQYYTTNDNNSARIKKKADSAYNWWERSSYAGYANGFGLVGSSGNSSYGFAASTYGVAPGFCI